MANIKLRRGSGVPSGLTFGEPAFDITNNRFYVGITGGSALIGVAGGGVHSFNGLTGAVTGVTTGTANTFGPLQSFTNGISSAGGTFSGTQIFTNGATFSGLATFNSGISATGGITFNAPIISTRLARTSSVVFDTKTGNFSPAEADNGKVFVINISGKTTVTVTLDGLSTGWRAKFLVLGGTGVNFQSSLGTVLGTYGVDGGGIGAVTEMVEVYCYGTGTYFAG